MATQQHDLDPIRATPGLELSPINSLALVPVLTASAPFASSSLVGSDGNDTFFVNSKVPGVGVGST